MSTAATSLLAALVSAAVTIGWLSHFDRGRMQEAAHIAAANARMRAEIRASGTTTSNGALPRSTAPARTNGDAASGLAPVARNGKILFEKAYGLADLAKGTAGAPETKFRIGSVTKQFTAAATAGRSFGAAGFFMPARSQPGAN